MNKDTVEKCCGDRGASVFQKKDNCPPSSWKDIRKPCARKQKGCHNSYEKFKQKGKDTCQSAEDTFSPKCKDPSKHKDKSSSSFEAFFKKNCKTKEHDCHDSQDAFKNMKGNDMSSSTDECKSKKTGPCSTVEDMTTKKGEPCATKQTVPKKNGPCATKQAVATKSDQCDTKQAVPTEREPCATKQAVPTKSDPCACSSRQTVSTKSELCTGMETGSTMKSGPCSSASKKPCKSTTANKEEASVFSKIANYCKCLGKGYVKDKNNKTVSEAQKQIARTGLAPTKPPCPPSSEQAKEKAKKCQCTSRVTCPQVSTLTTSDFFPMDARNKELNDCIEKYMKVDPSQVISKCSKFASKPSDMSEKCLQSAKKSRNMTYALKRSGLSPHSLQMARRWAPSAALYLTTAAMLTVYVCEWKPILKYVPLYSHLAQQDEQ